MQSGVLVVSFLRQQIKPSSLIIITKGNICWANEISFASEISPEFPNKKIFHGKSQDKVPVYLKDLMGTPVTFPIEMEAKK